MRVVAIENMGPESALVIQERGALPCPIGCSRIAVEAFGVNRADLLQRAGRYPAPKGTVPDVPGLEFSGRVVETTEGSRWSIGDAVMGLVSGGGYATEVVCEDGHLLPKPESMSWSEAAGVVEAYLTAWDAMVLQGGLKASSTVLIHAAGSGVGVAAIQVARWIGAEVLGTTRSAWKAERLNKNWDIPVILRQEEWWTDARISGRCDLVVDLVGGVETARGLHCLSQQGTIAVVGLTAGVRSEIRLDQLLARRARMFGTVLRSRSTREKDLLFYRFEREVLPGLKTGELRSPTEESYHVTSVEEAHGRVASNQTFGKVIVTWTK